MIVAGATPSGRDRGPSWYLIGDLACTELSAITTLAATGVAVTMVVRAARDQRVLRVEHHPPLPITGQMESSQRAGPRRSSAW